MALIYKRKIKQSYKYVFVGQIYDDSKSMWQWLIRNKITNVVTKYEIMALVTKKDIITAMSPQDILTIAYSAGIESVLRERQEIMQARKESCYGIAC